MSDRTRNGGLVRATAPKVNVVELQLMTAVNDRDRNSLLLLLFLISDFIPSLLTALS